MHALLLTLCGPGDTVIVPRNAHKSMLAGLIFTGATPLYMEPAIDPLWGIPLQVRAADALAALERAPQARALFVTSPTYNGLGADLATIGTLSHEAGVPFVTDQAWGPHLRFCPELPIDAMAPAPTPPWSARTSSSAESPSRRCSWRAASGSTSRASTAWST